MTFLGEIFIITFKGKALIKESLSIYKGVLLRMLRGISDIVSHMCPVGFLPRQIGRGIGGRRKGNGKCRWKKGISKNGRGGKAKGERGEERGRRGRGRRSGEICNGKWQATLANIFSPQNRYILVSLLI